MKRTRLNATLVASILIVAGCDRGTASGPPTIRLGDAVCDECGMIISDERFATVTVVNGDRGAEPKLFDDFNCQKDYERSDPDLDIIERWSHDYNTSKWISPESAFFVKSEELRTPMGSQAAAIETEAAAKLLTDQLQGIVLNFDSYWTD